MTTRARVLPVLPTMLLLILAACTAPQSSGAAPSPTPPSPATSSPATQAPEGFPPAPPVTDGALDPAVSRALDDLADGVTTVGLDGAALDTVAASGDARLAWFVSDLLRFLQGRDADALVGAFEQLTGVDPREDPSTTQSAWVSVTDHLIAWDLPAAPGYRELKAELFLNVEPGWAPFFADADSLIDWRLVSWGGVLIDDRPAGDQQSCLRGCIPALDDPPLTDAVGGSWYPDEAIVFGAVVGSEAVAFPKNIMQVHEMVNLTIGGRRLGLPYCTLCGSAQAYVIGEELTLRTSGLLSRSNKVMYDLNTRSVFDTFTGRALSGPLQDADVQLEQISVVASTWGEWKQAHPDTSILAEDGGIGRQYPADPLQGRDDDGPIFPIGPADPRLPVQAAVVGVVVPDGAPLAFPVDQARAALAEGRPVTLGDVELRADAGGLRAYLPGGEEVPAHEAFWFAWSQFHPTTQLWSPVGQQE